MTASQSVKFFARVVALALALAPVTGAAQPGPASSDPLAPIAQLVAVRRESDALERLDALPREARTTGAARYLRARLLETLSRPSEAADALAPPSPDWPEVIAADARERRARLLVRARRCDEARPELEAVEQTGAPATARVRALAGECALATGDHPRAIALLRQVLTERPSGVDLYTTRLQLAKAFEAADRRDDAVRELRVLLVERPEHRNARAVLDQMEALAGAPRFTVVERMDRAERLHRANRWRDAIAELDAVRPPRARAARARYLHLRGMALFRTRQEYETAARVLAEASRLGGPEAAEDAFNSALALARAGRDRDAIRAYRRVVSSFPRHRNAARAEVEAARLEIRGRSRAGERSLERFLASPRAREHADIARDATWELAFDAFERRRWARAADLFDRYAQSGTGAMVRARGLYWLGRARWAQRDRRRAIEAWRGALHVEPLHWYALLARERLVEAQEDPGPPFPAAVPAEGSDPPPLAPPVLPDEVAFYARLGLRADAISALQKHETAIEASAPAGRGLEAIASAYRLVGDAERPYRLLARRDPSRLDRPPIGANRWAWDASYPKPWLEVVEQSTREAGIEPEYLYAIMRQESGYNPTAISYADAIGLVQLLPSTARAVAEGAGIQLSRDMLFDPAINVRLGAKYAGGQLRRFVHAPLAFGAYNAGGARVGRWLRETGEIELDRFVERIPVDQTRNYVRRVTTHYAKYLYLRDPERGWPLDLPERVGP